MTTYPRVYLGRLPSGVRAISGVSASVTAFVEEVARGQIGLAEQIFNFTDFDWIFGALTSNYAFGYAA